MPQKEPLAVHKVDLKGNTWFSITFRPDALPQLARALASAGRSVNGYGIEAFAVHVAENGSPAWAEDLEFDSENDLFCVRCTRPAPLRFLVRRLQKRLDKPSALRRDVRASAEP